MLTDHSNYFTVAFCSKFASRLVLYFPLHLKHVTTLLCKTTAADTFDFQQVIDGVGGRVQVRENEPDIRPSWG